MFASKAWRRKLLSVAVVCMAATSPLHALPTVFTGADPGEGLDLSGTFIYAFNVGTSAGPGLIGSANFKSDGYGGSANGSTSVTTGAQVTAANVVNAGGWGAPNFGPGIDDVRLGAVMNNIRWNGAPNDVIVNLPNLTIGDTYKVQLLLGEQCCNRGFDVVLDGNNLGSTGNLLVNQGGAQGATNKGTVFTHTFVATSKVANIVLDQNIPGFGDNNPILNGLTLEHVSAAGPVAVQNVVGGVFTGAAPGQGLDFGGVITHAVNVGGRAAIINGVTFEAGAPGDTPSNVALSTVNHIPNWANPNFGSSPDDNELEFVMQSIRWTAANQESGDVGIQLSDLKAGNNYKVQLLFTESCCGRGFDVFVDDLLVADDFSPLGLQGVASGTPTNGAVLAFEFFATDSHVSIRLNGLDTPFGDKNPTLSALLVADITIPEPASAMMGLLGLGALALRGRRNRAA